MRISWLARKVLEYKNSPVIFFILWFLFFVVLSFFRDARLDENIYLSESVQISNLLQQGEWIGNYGVGLHGFLNKLLVGIIFIFTGPSVFIATLTNILFGVFSGVYFYKILFIHFKFSKLFSLLGVMLLFSSYQFLTYIPTFYRDIPSLFFLLIVIDSVLSKRRKWLIGLFLVLLLDAKEHVFYTVAPAFIIWIGLESYTNSQGKWSLWITEFIISGLQLFLPSLIFLILMFTTSIIPLNIYNGNILGLVESGLEPMATNFSLEMSTYNRDLSANKSIVKVMPMLLMPDGASSVISFSISFVNTLLAYLGKILYPRTFSFLSIPFIILVPATMYAYGYLRKCSKKLDTTQLLLPILLFVFLLIYIFHASTGRYMIPISPVVFLFFLMFLKDLKSKRKETGSILIWTLLFAIGGLYFEYSYVLVKIALNLVLFLMLLFLYFPIFENNKLLKSLVVILVSTFFVGTALLASYTNGQIRGYRIYGYNRECEKIVSLVNKKDKIWINDINWDRLPFIFREEDLGIPEWRWSLKEWIPKKRLILKNKHLSTYDYYWSKEENLLLKAKEYEIKKLVYVKVSDTSYESLLLQDRLEELLDSEWIELQGTWELKNKTIYVFNVL